jgi:hypothetical protein
MEQREEENQQEIAKLKAEIKSLKLELFQLKSKLRISNFFIILKKHSKLKTPKLIKFP